MAIFHLSHKAISRGQGQSIVAAAAYQSRGRIQDERSGQVKDYTRKAEQELLFSGVYAPKNAPEWARDRGALWNAAERAEDEHNKTRAKVAITGQHIEIALPHELTAEQNRYALQDFIRDNFTRHGYAVDLNIHGPDRDGDQRNIHAHLLITMRTLNEKGFSPVKLQMDRTELSKWVTHWRKGWEKTANRHLERHGHEARIDHRSLEAQGIDREASQHLGPTAAKMEREGKASERGNENRATTTRNRRRWERLRELHRELSQVNGEIATEQARSAQAYRMADAAHTPTVGWWQAARARAAMHQPTPTQAHAKAAGPAPSPKQAPAQRATPPPARPLSPAEAFEKEENESRLARVMREREERRRREREEERQPGRSIADDWLDGLFKKSDGPR